MKLTARCTELLRLLATARWLTTDQVHRRFFPQASVDAARKRLRKLADAGYLVARQQNRMSVMLFALGPEGKRVLEDAGIEEIKVERTPPKQFAHFTGINDIRLAVEGQTGLSYFFACWELPAIGWRHPVIPDAVFAIQLQTFAAEFDRGQESIQFFLKTKIETYRSGLAGFPLAGLLVITDSEMRQRSLMKGIPEGTLRILFGTIDAMRRSGLDGFLLDHRGRQTSLVEVSCQTLLTRREGQPV